ncbi:MAG: DUF1353 domain-containing protein [Candidatus Auribacterota bacterium]|nr:DUF1353 domain-containing protein [Candidatus Auribacterota bacterium]
MSVFTENLVVSPLPDGRTWVLRKKFSYDVGREGSGETIKVSVGFVTDFASVPRVFWWIFPKWGKYGNATVIHDYLYWTQQEKYSRKRADEIFLEGMRDALGVSTIKAYLLYYFVRAGGWMAWRKNKKDKQKRIRKFIKLTDEMIEIPRMILKGIDPNEITATDNTTNG